MMFFVSQMCLYSNGLILTPGFNQSSRGDWGKYSCLFVRTACWRLLRLLCLGFMACRGTFQSCEENDPNHKSGWDLDPDKLVCTTFCRGNVTDPAFSHTFCGFHPLMQPTKF